MKALSSLRERTGRTSLEDAFLNLAEAACAPASVGAAEPALPTPEELIAKVAEAEKKITNLHVEEFELTREVLAPMSVTVIPRVGPATTECLGGETPGVTGGAEQKHIGHLVTLRLWIMRR